MRIFRLILAPLLFLVALGLPVAEASAAERAPHITYSDGSGLKFLAIPAIWKDSGKSSYQWSVNGKAVSGATKLSFTVNKALLGKKIQLKESRKVGREQSAHLLLELLDRSSLTPNLR